MALNGWKRLGSVSWCSILGMWYVRSNERSYHIIDRMTDAARDRVDQRVYIVVKNPNSDRVNDNESITIHLGRMSYFPTDVV